MICTELYNGQGLGNQLWLYAVTRTKALDLGVDFGIMSPEKFKGLHFLDLDFGRQVFGGSGPEGGPPLLLPDQLHGYYREPLVRHSRSLVWHQKRARSSVHSIRGLRITII